MTDHNLNFDDVTLIEIPFSLNGKDYVLCEATGDAACKYRNALLACTELGPEGKPSSVKGMADVEPMLISLCLFLVQDNKRKAVTAMTIRSWSNRIQKRLFEKTKEISQLDEEDTLETLKEERDNIDKRIATLDKGTAKNG